VSAVAFAPLIKRAPCKPNDPMRIAVFVSGHGSNLQALINDTKRSTSPYQIALIISNEKDAFALKRADHAGLPHKVISHRDFKSRAEFDKALIKACKAAKIEFVVLAGFMRLLGSDFLKEFANKVLNIHPALCPAFPGLHAQRQALQAGVWYSGCTVQIVNEGVDTGPIVAQSVVPIFGDDDEDKLIHRIQAKEHKLLKAVIRAVAKGKVVSDGRSIKMLERDKLLN
jgi:phosphoribosylglycinamide formyltransferase-1